MKEADLGWEGEVMRSGVVQRFPFVLKVDSRGLYLLSFDATLTRREESVGLRSMPDYVPQQVWAEGGHRVSGRGAVKFHGSP